MGMVFESFQEFAGRQKRADGARAEWIIGQRLTGYRTGDESRIVYFENGARSDGNAHYDPPEDESDRLEAIRDFFAAALKEERRRWEEYRAESLNQSELARRFSNLPPGCTEETVRVLQEGQERIAMIEERLAEAEAKLLETPKYRALEEQKQRREEQENKRLAYLNELAGVVRNLSI
jgi:hypothetical protein